MTQEVIWEPQEGPQTKLLTCPCFEVFFGGARGGGKTDGMLGEFASHAALYGADAIGLMVRRQHTELVETIERSRRIYSPIGAKFNQTQSMWMFPNGARLRFAHLERDSDADAYQGHSYSRVYIEEAGTFPSDKPILKLMATLRSGAGVPVGMRLTGNPGGPGQQWVKARYIDPHPQGMKVGSREFDNPFTGGSITRDWVYIPSRISDNKYLGDDYIANISMSGSPQLVRAWLHGDFSIVEGAFFDEWDTLRHVIEPFPIPDSWVRFRSMDWGSAAPFSVGWWAIVPDDYPSARPGLGLARASSDRIVLPRGAIVRYREWYGATAPQKGLKLTAETVAWGIKERDGDDKITYSVLDPSAFAEDGGPSIAERMGASHQIYFRKADNKRVSQKGAMGGWDQLRSRLHGDAEGRPMVVCFDTCPDSIRTIPCLQHDPDKAEDLDTEAEDHAADEWRYACMSRPWTPVRREIKPKLRQDYIQRKPPPDVTGWATY